MLMNSYPYGSAIRLSVAFTLVGTTTPADPSDVLLGVLQLPSTLQNFTFGNGQIVRDGAGLYHYDFLPIEPGRYEYTFEGIGLVEAGTPNIPFTVLNSNLAA